MEIPEENYMGRGKAKVVYRHPFDDSICIKFPNQKKKRALIDIRREISYLKKHQDKLPFLAPYLGTIQCNMGTGYMYQIVKNEDGTPSEHIRMPDVEEYSAKAIEEKAESIYLQLIEQHAVVNDLNTLNIFVRKKENDFDLILIDGFGNNNLIKIADYSKYFLVKKLNRKFHRLCANLNLSPDFIRE